MRQCNFAKILIIQIIRKSLIDWTFIDRLVFEFSGFAAVSMGFVSLSRLAICKEVTGLNRFLSACFYCIVRAPTSRRMKTRIPPKIMKKVPVFRPVCLAKKPFSSSTGIITSSIGSSTTSTSSTIAA